ncbi:hypothetical protein NDU88_009034 [Pleurodeles waltl]|uniref:Uncharacterized protein n=1 Tax=Pleurodeles waltl TaxID=8319 RepID=A0AAV7QTM5_PLEWA|nr:hypothetical protein NDU88_009034 [Pleurodeles waltl]
MSRWKRTCPDPSGSYLTSMCRAGFSLASELLQEPIGCGSKISCQPVPPSAPRLLQQKRRLKLHLRGGGDQRHRNRVFSPSG